MSGVRKAKYQLCDMDIRKAFLERNKEFFKSNVFANEFGINSTNVVDFASFDFNKNKNERVGVLRVFVKNHRNSDGKDK